MKRINIILFAIILIACEGEKGEIGPTGVNSLINITNEPAGIIVHQVDLRLKEKLLPTTITIMTQTK